MNEQQARALIDRWVAQIAQHDDAARRCTYSETVLAHGGWAAGLEEAAVDLVVLLDGREAAVAFRERLHGWPADGGEQPVRHLSEKNLNIREAS
ncbi:hypothetical protein [Streptomyces platensis]|uniref:hypothetical protein n=1 Tax=Streptomyces platensis TaxID=58346 RepID=UPI003324D33E